MAESTSKALQIPEILSNIFSKIRRDGDLTCCALVCRQWSALAIQALWQDATPSVFVMESMYEAGTLAKFVPLIRNMEIGCRPCGRDRECTPALKHKEFLKEEVFNTSRAVSLSMYLQVGYMRPKFVAGLIQSRLRSLFLGDGTYGNDLLDLLQNKTPNLESLHIVNRAPESMTTERLLDFLNNMPRLREIRGVFWNLPNSILLHLATKQNLEVLQIYRFESADWYSSLVDASRTSSPFSALREFRFSDGSIHDKSLFKILPFFRNLQKLELETVSAKDCTAYFTSLVNCPLLADVHIQLPIAEGSEIPDPFLATCLVSLAEACPMLIHFCLNNYLPRDCSHFDISGSDFGQFVTSLPRLKSLLLPFTCDLGVAEMRALQSCRRLHTLTMADVRLNYAELEACTNPPVVSQLRYLRLKCSSREYYRLPHTVGASVTNQWKDPVMQQYFPVAKFSTRSPNRETP